MKLDDKSTATLHLEVVTYIGQMSAELSTMARNSAMPLLSYFLDMSAAEARSTEGQLRDKLQLDLAPEDVPVEIPNA